MSAEPTISALAQAQQRAMPITRLLDYGMGYADAVALFAATSNGEPWHEAAERLADSRLADAEKAQSSSHLATMDEALRCALADLIFAQMAFNEDTGEKARLYARVVDTFSRLATLRGIERMTVPYRHANLVGWLVRPTGPAIGTVIVIGGLSGWGGAYLSIADALAARGLATVLAEGPGQGEPRLTHGLYLDAGVGDAFGLFVDAVVARDDLGPSVGVWGNSFGGLFAAHTAHSDPRIAACCVNGAPAVPVVPDFRNAREQIMAAVGASSIDEAISVCEGLVFDPQRNRIPGALLVLSGGNDPLCSLSDQQPFLDACPPDRATLRIWDDGEHTIYNHAADRNSFVADWFADSLSGQNAL